MIAIVLGLTAVTAVAQRSRATRPPVRILWVGAHPDDEALVAPLLGPLCVEHGNDCVLLILTDGSPVRAAEAQHAADSLHSHLTQWDLLDTFDISQWGDHKNLVSRLSSFIASVAPTLVYTFDPRHGSSCHPAHREAGQLTLDAVASLSGRVPSVNLLETLIERDTQSRIIGFTPATSSAISIDATATWHYLVDDAAIHASQFDSTQIELLRAIPLNDQRVWLLPASVAAPDVLSCPP